MDTFDQMLKNQLQLELHSINDIHFSQLKINTCHVHLGQTHQWIAKKLLNNKLFCDIYLTSSKNVNTLN